MLFMKTNMLSSVVLKCKGVARGDRGWNIYKITVYIYLYNIIDISINGVSTENSFWSQRTPIIKKKSKMLLYRFGDKNRGNSNIFTATILKFLEKFNLWLSHVLIIGNLFPKSNRFVDMLVTSCIKDTCSNLSLSIIS